MNKFFPIATNQTEDHFVYPKCGFRKVVNLFSSEKAAVLPVKIDFNQKVNILALSLTDKMVTDNPDLNMCEICLDSVQITALYFEIIDKIYKYDVVENQINVDRTFLVGGDEMGTKYKFSLDIDYTELRSAYGLCPDSFYKFWFFGEFFLNSESGSGQWSLLKDPAGLIKKSPWSINKPVGFDIEFEIGFDTLENNRNPNLKY